ncbi:CobW family GTP-binding protein [Acidocella aromatica]|uniref:G3E family GTPase n=1 Tax=Acidocella aromatica TaxID=1303579 RepID=A0A840VS53_9PROT|nr:GTP-binding protein [Acidocella aromatica]MBB5374431.1 G3E family GTPase [Acidocella aromatica]
MIDMSPLSSVLPVDRIAVCLLTGFLGSGKTTLLNQLTKHPEMDGTVVLINEFGEVGIDHHLVETMDESILLLDSGCLCCSVHGDFVRVLRDLHERASRREIPPIKRVIVETTGLADPMPVIYSLMEDRYIAARYVCDSVLTVVDASRGRAQLEQHQEAIRQIVMADRLLIAKSDISERTTLEALQGWLDTLNPSAQRLRVTHGNIAPEQLFSSGIYALSPKIPDIAAWLGEKTHQRLHPGNNHYAHDPDVSSFTVRFERPVTWRGLSVVMGLILQEFERKLLCAKGVVNVAGLTEPVVLQCVQGTAYPPVRLKHWPATGPLSDRHGCLVFIGRGLESTAHSEIERRLAILPNDEVAMRTIAATPLLPTRCWLNERMPWLGRGCYDTPNWIVQPPIRPHRSVH